jgi:hypothetical protein
MDLSDLSQAAATIRLCVPALRDAAANRVSPACPEPASRRIAMRDAVAVVPTCPGKTSSARLLARMSYGIHPWRQRIVPRLCVNRIHHGVCAQHQVWLEYAFRAALVKGFTHGLGLSSWYVTTRQDETLAAQGQTGTLTDSPGVSKSACFRPSRTRYDFDVNDLPAARLECVVDSWIARWQKSSRMNQDFSKKHYE